MMDGIINETFKITFIGSGQAAQLVRVWSRETKAAGLIPGQGTYKKSTNECKNKWNNKSMFLSLSQIHKFKKNHF